MVGRRRPAHRGTRADRLSRRRRASPDRTGGRRVRFAGDAPAVAPDDRRAGGGAARDVGAAQRRRPRRVLRARGVGGQGSGAAAGDGRRADDAAGDARRPTPASTPNETCSAVAARRTRRARPSPVSSHSRTRSRTAGCSPTPSGSPTSRGAGDRPVADAGRQFVSADAGRLRHQGAVDAVDPADRERVQLAAARAAAPGGEVGSVGQRRRRGARRRVRAADLGRRPVAREGAWRAGCFGAAGRGGRLGRDRGRAAATSTRR